MKNLLHSRSFYIVIALMLIVLAVFAVIRVIGKNGTSYVTATVTEGEIVNIVSVSGIIEAKSSADLAFPVGGIVSEVLVREGDAVVAGEVLMKLEQAALAAERESVYAELLIAQADRDELISGPSSEERSVTETTVAIAEEDLERTIAEEEAKVENARRKLLSDGLEALPVKKDNDDARPIVSGTYACFDEGEYHLSVFRSNARSGYSYRLSGLESGTFTAYTESPAPLGTCGLSLQFVDGEFYGNEDWVISVPNTRSDAYVTNLNAYELALKQEENNVRAKEQALDLALSEQTLENADPRGEALLRENARVMQAGARLDAIEADIDDRTLRTPFSGIVNSIEAIPGETVTTAPVITVVADDTFELTARIPEIDVTKIAVGQKADVVFDARSDEIIPAEISFISPLAIEIDGVAYFEATLTFPKPPSWLRGGLNADIDIIVDRKENALRIPKRFLSENDGAYSVLIPHGDTVATTAVDVGFIGNDGYIEIIGLRAGDIVVAP